ncbi:MAG: site-2 protease family protein [Novosphingobium sp.]
MNETLLLAIILIPSLIVAIVFHEVAHGWVANMLGDPTAKERRRLSLNPLRHVDPMGTIIIPGIMALAKGPIFGWAKPVPVNKYRLNNPRYGMMAVAAAGPGTNFVLAAVGAVLLGTFFPEQARIMQPTTLLGFGLFMFISINIFLAFFNLLPIPPFDGSHIVEGLLPRDLARSYARLRPAGMLFLFGLIILSWLVPGLGIIENVVLPPVAWLRGLFLQLAIVVAGT